MLNDIRYQIRGYIDSRLSEISKGEAMLPLLKYTLKSHGPNCGCELEKWVEDIEAAMVKMRKTVAEGEEFLLDVVELMATYHLAIENLEDGDKGHDSHGASYGDDYGTSFGADYGTSFGTGSGIGNPPGTPSIGYDSSGMSEDKVKSLIDRIRGGKFN